MTQGPIVPEKITKPIQVLAAWLAGLFAIDSCFLFAAARMEVGSIESIALVVAAILNVPIFLIAVFLLQTKFRPELQEDSYYSTYLSQKTNQPIKVEKEIVIADELFKRLEVLEEHTHSSSNPKEVSKESIQHLVFGVNSYLDDIDTIKSKLAKHGFLRCTSFEGVEPPKHRVVSISQHLSTEVQNEVLKIVSELGFKKYKLYDNVRDEAEEDVLLGSYGEPKFEVFAQNSA